MALSFRACMFAVTMCAMSWGSMAHAQEAWCDIPVAGLRPTSTMDKSLNLAMKTPPAAPSVLHIEGNFPTDPIYKASKNAQKDLFRMQNIAFAWRITRDPAALQQAERYLNAWVKNYKPSYNPITETHFDALFSTYAIIEPELSKADNDRIRSYMRAWGQGYVKRIDAAGNAVRSKDPNIWSNNWQSHRIKLITTIAVILNDDALFADAQRLFRQQVSTNINGKTGEVLDFARRDAIHYVVFDLQPLIQAALAAQMRGQDWYYWKAPSGASVALAMNWLRPYATGLKTHEEFVHSGVAFDAKRRAAKLKGFYGTFDPKLNADIYWYAAKFDPSFGPIAKSLQPNPPTDLKFCGR